MLDDRKPVCGDGRQATPCQTSCFGLLLAMVTTRESLRDGGKSRTNRDQFIKKETRIIHSKTNILFINFRTIRIRKGLTLGTRRTKFLNINKLLIRHTPISITGRNQRMIFHKITQSYAYILFPSRQQGSSFHIQHVLFFLLP